MMDDSNLSLLKDIPGFKAIVRAVLKSQMKHLVRTELCREKTCLQGFPPGPHKPGCLASWDSYM